MSVDPWFPPDWPAPANVRAATTTRAPGHSRGPYASFNLGSRCGDDPEHVAANRIRLQEGLALPEPPRWLRELAATNGLSHHLHILKEGTPTVF